VEIAFDRGQPTAVNGVAMPFIDLIGSLTVIAGAHGVGRIRRVDQGSVGSASRWVYEAPAAVVLHAAHKELQRFVTTRELDRFARAISVQYTDIVAQGLWFSPFREALDAFVDKVQQQVTGAICVELFKGRAGIGRAAIGLQSSTTTAAIHPSLSLGTN
jgi:argininosuccinate synthase